MKVKRARKAFWPRYVTLQAVMKPDDYWALRAYEVVEVDDRVAEMLIARGSVAAAEDAPAVIAEEETTNGASC